MQMIESPLGLDPKSGIDERRLLMAQQIQEYDLSLITDRLTRDGKLDADDVPGVTREFKRFMVLVALDLKPLAMIGPLIDEVWHQFVLFTPQYREFCNSIFGRFIDHQPDTPRTPVPVQAGNNFLRGYENFFGPLDPLWFRGMDEKTIAYYLRPPLLVPPDRQWSGWTG